MFGKLKFVCKELVLLGFGLVTDLFKTLEIIFYFLIYLVLSISIPIYKSLLLYVAVIILFAIYYYKASEREVFVSPHFKESNSYMEVNTYSQVIDFLKHIESNDRIFYATLYSVESMVPFSFVIDDYKMRFNPVDSVEEQYRLDSGSLFKSASCFRECIFEAYNFAQNKFNFKNEQPSLLNNDIPLAKDSSYPSISLYFCSFPYTKSLGIKNCTFYFDNMVKLKNDRDLLLQEIREVISMNFLQKLLSGILLFIYVSGLNKMTRRSG